MWVEPGGGSALLKFGFTRIVLSMGKSQGTPLLTAGGMDRRAQHRAASKRCWLFSWNLPWTNRGGQDREKN